MVERPPQLNAVFTALGDPTRRAILARLRKAPATVTEIAEPFAVSLNAVSKHLKSLERARLVTRTRVGREHRLSLNAAPLRQAAGWLVDYQQFWENALDRMEQELVRRKHRS